MKIDWKALAKTEGYISLKEAYAVSLLREFRWRTNYPAEKRQLHRKFMQAIGKVKSEASILGISMKVVINSWELQRAKEKHGWDSFYGPHHRKISNSGVLKPLGIRGLKKHYKRMNNDPARIRDRIISEAVGASNKKPHRWVALAKRKAKSLRALKIKHGIK